MDNIHGRGEVSATHILADLPNPPTRTVVCPMLGILEEKGHLAHRKKSREFIYESTRARTRVGLAAFRRVIRTVFESSLEKALAVHLADPESELSEDELKRMGPLIHHVRGR